MNDKNQEYVWEAPDEQPAQSVPNDDTLTGVQMLRGLAALAVAIAHLHAVELKLGGPVFFGDWALAGFGGVDLFFVISGFVMVWVTRQHHGKLQKIGQFWFLRFLRIYPLWWLVLGAIFAVYLVRPEWVYQSHASNPNVLTSFFLIPDKDLPLHAVGWTLIHELWFYLVFGILLFFPKKILPIFLGAWGALIIACLFANYSPIDPWLKLIRHPLSLEFIMGAGIGVLACSKKFANPRALVFIACAALIISIIITSTSAQDFFAHESNRVFLFGVPCAILVWGIVGMEQKGYSAPKPLRALGDWSYALYLIHVPVFAAIGRLARPFANDGVIDNILINIVALATAIFAAFILHQLFEKPIMKLARRNHN